VATHEERRQATLAKVLDAARALFVEHGIEATSTEAVRRAAGVSRGAMYHHFASRGDLIAAVYEREAAAAIDRAAQRIPARGSAIERLLAGCMAWLDEATVPDVARIVVQDGPAALGSDRARALEATYSLRPMVAILRSAQGDGELDVPDVELLARMLNGLLTESVIAIATSTDTARARRNVEYTLQSLLAGMQTPRPP
jgi:AcrR family transcriptional regulator